MDQAPRELPPNALTAFRREYPAEQPVQADRAKSLRQGDCGDATITLEAVDEGVVLRLARDCPFDEICPAYLAIFVHRLTELCPDVAAAFRPGYGHPIVATLALELTYEASPEEWSAAMLSTHERLELALSKQGEATSSVRGEDLAEAWHLPWPEFEVSQDQLVGLGELPFGLASDARDAAGARQTETSLLRRLQTLDLLRPEHPWVKVLHRQELHLGFWDGVEVSRFTAGELAGTLNAICQGNRYNTTLLRRAIGAGLIERITTRARGLAKGSDPINGA